MINILCPVCRAPIQRGERVWRCTNAHTFDVAREGYVNLLPVQQKKSRAPGDNDALVRARREFLAAGHYQPLRDAVLDMLTPLAPRRLLDIGCGEGYYTEAMGGLELTGASSPAPEIIGIDIAKNAVQLAARKHRAVATGITWLVGSSASLPLGNASVDLVTSLFSPLPAAEMSRVLEPGGHLLVVTPGADHLQAMRAALFDDVRPHVPEKFVDELKPAFELVGRRDIRCPLNLDKTALENLLTMTPYAWHAAPGKRDALIARDSLVTEAVFALLLFRRTDDGDTAVSQTRTPAAES